MSATRRELIAWGASASLALADPSLAADLSDAEQLERLLVLEHRLEDAYRMGLERNAIARGLGETLLAHEREHVRGLEEGLRGIGRRAPRASVPPPASGAAFASRRAFARFALELETATVGAYEEVLATYGNVRLLQPLGSIMCSGAQHQVALRQVLGADLLDS